jgi:hypothetical protein
MEDQAVEPLRSALSAKTEAELFEFEECLSQRLYAIDGESFAEQAGDSGRSDDGFLYARCYVMAKGSGRPATVTAEMESRIVHATLHDTPVNATHWSTRTLAEHLGTGATTIRRVWQSNGLKPHLSQLQALA